MRVNDFQYTTNYDLRISTRKLLLTTKSLWSRRHCMGGRSHVITRICVTNALTRDYFFNRSNRSKTVAYAYTVGTDTPRIEQVS